MTAWKQRCALIISRIAEQARIDGVSYEELRERISAAYPFEVREGQQQNRNWRRIAHWYMQVHARRLREVRDE